MVPIAGRVVQRLALAARPVRSQARLCSGAEQQPTQGGEQRLPSGGRLNKGAVVPAGEDGVGEEAPTPKHKKDMWFIRDQHSPLAPYAGYGSGDKGYAFASKMATEHPDLTPLEDMSLRERELHSQVTEKRFTALSQERKARQASLLLKVHGRRALSTLLGPEDGVVTVERDGPIVIVRLMGVRDKMTGGMLDQISDLLIQLHNMGEVTGIIFHVCGHLKGIPVVDASVSTAVAREAVASAQRLSIDMMHVQPITVCVFTRDLEGVALELMTHCDFMFATPQATVNFTSTGMNQSSMMGGLMQLSERMQHRRAMLLAGRGQPLGAEVAEGVGLLDKVVANPLEDAKTFLRSFPKETWRILRKLKDTTTSATLNGMKEGFIKEQYHFRHTWGSAGHLEAVQAIRRSL